MKFLQNFGVGTIPSICFRYNDPYLNRFLQPDTIIPNLYNPQDLNRYSYIQNRPIDGIDPTGHWRVEDTGGRIGNDCKNYPQYCDGWKIKSPEKLAKMRITKNGDVGDSSDRRDKITPQYRQGPPADFPPNDYDYYEYKLGNGKYDGVPYSPDYYSLVPSFSLPVVGAVLNASFPIILDRYGNMYIGGGVSIGPEAYAVGTSGQLVGGWVFNGPPGERRLEKYLQGPFWNASGGAIFGGGINGSFSSSENSGEGGFFFPPQASVTIGDTFMVYDSNRQKPLWLP